MRVSRARSLGKTQKTAQMLVKDLDDYTPEDYHRTLKMMGLEDGFSFSKGFISQVPMLIFRGVDFLSLDVGPRDLSDDCVEVEVQLGMVSRSELRR